MHPTKPQKGVAILPRGKVSHSLDFTTKSSRLANSLFKCESLVFNTFCEVRRNISIHIGRGVIDIPIENSTFISIIPTSAE